MIGSLRNRDSLSTSNETKIETIVLRHLDAAYNLARWLLGNDQDAEDVVQDASIRALDSLESFRGEDGKAWFLTIVRNTSLNCIRQRKSNRMVELDPEDIIPDGRNPSPEELVIRVWQKDAVTAAMSALPPAYLELIVLRELEDMSYKQIAEVAGIPIGTVMSRLSRARQCLQLSLVASNAVESR